MVNTAFPSLNSCILFIHLFCVFFGVAGAGGPHVVLTFWFCVFFFFNYNSCCLQENSYLLELGNIDLDLPEPPEKASGAPPQPVDLYLRYGPKAEITHIFRSPEKRPPPELSLAFFALVLLPILGFVVGVSL